jgi:HD-GYP domain-containing protein (c-di-GMP phosphodiesterase class II)
VIAGGRKVPLAEAVVGQVVAAPVVSASGQILIEEGAILTRQLLDLLDLWGVAAVSVRETAAPLPRAPAPAPSRRRAEPYRYDERRVAASKEAIKTVHRQAKSLAEQILVRVRSDRAGASPEELRRIALALVDESIDGQEVAAAVLHVRAFDDYLFAHSVNVSVLSVLVGHAMGLSRTDLQALAAGGLVHDAGMARLSREIWDKDGPLTEAEYAEVRRHPALGADSLKSAIAGMPEIGPIVLQHHERLDGSGYPDGLRGDSIHPLARVTAVCDVFDAMRGERRYRPKFLPYDAMAHVMQASTSTLDPDVVRAFVRYMSVYPIGSFVLLNTGEIGVVLAANEFSPVRPVVKVFRDVKGEVFRNPRVADLSEDRRYIVSAVDPDRLGVDGFQAY